MRRLTALEATSRYSLATSREFRLVGSLTGGETGATAIEGSDGERRVLKWEGDRDDIVRRSRAIGLAERLRTRAAWPVPRQHAIEVDGWLLVSQQFMSGQTVDHLSHRLIDDVLSIHRRRLGLAAPDDQSSWAEDMIEVLVSGGNGYCTHEPLRTHDARTRRVVERIETIGNSLTPPDLFGHDIVHADLHPGNMLQVDGTLSAVVDLDFAQVGDATFDLACLAVSSLGIDAEAGVRRRLFTECIDVLDDNRRAAYIANLLLRNLDWAIRKNRSVEVEFWLGQSDRLLAGR